MSVIIPVRNGAAELAACLKALAASSFNDYEVIVVDDGSTDGSGDVARRLGATVIQTAGGRGAAAARNLGARESRGKILFFLDADVVVTPDTLGQLKSAFAQRPAVSAVIGSYAPTTPAAGFFSKFKNIHHHYIHQISRAEAATFWTGCGAVTREAFQAVGGFDAGRYPGATVEDIEFGYRLTAAGFRVFLAKDIQVQHLKHYTLWSMMRSDICYRAIPWTKLMLLRRRFRSDLNTTPGNAASVVLATALVVAVGAAPWRPLSLLAVPASLALFALNTRAFNGYVKKHLGWRFMVATFFMSIWYFLYAGFGLALGIIAAAAALLKKNRPGNSNHVGS